MRLGLATLLSAHLVAAAAQQPPAVLDLTPPQPATPTTPATPATPALTEQVIKKAVRDTIAEDPRPLPVPAQQGGALRGDPVGARMSAAFQEAKVPDCLHDDALKLQPARIGPVNVVGPLSLPWVIAAAVRGKCR